MIRFNRLVYFFLLISTAAFSQENIMDYNNSLKFARYLISTTQYDFAAQEYERLNYLYPNDSILTLELVRTYRLGNKCEKIDRSLSLLSDKNRILKNTIYTKEYLNFSITCRNFNNYDKYTSLLSKQDIDFYNLSKYWLINDIDLLKSYTPYENEITNRKMKKLVLLTQKFNKEKYKKPGLAVLMSSIIPGSGKAYSNRWGDAIVSFIFVGTNSFVAYRAFSKKGVKSTNGWIFGGLAFSFYSANLWGSYKAAKNYNNHIKQSYQQNAENIIYTSF